MVGIVGINIVRRSDHGAESRVCRMHPILLVGDPICSFFRRYIFIYFLFFRNDSMPGAYCRTSFICSAALHYRMYGSNVTRTPEAVLNAEGFASLFTILFARKNKKNNSFIFMYIFIFNIPRQYRSSNRIRGRSFSCRHSRGSP